MGNRAACMTTLGAILPMTAAATPISATTEQQHQNKNNEDQFHSKSPLRSRLQMEGTDRGELSSARLEFHCRPSSSLAAFVTGRLGEGRIAERPALIVKVGTDAMRDRRTTGRSRWPPGRERRRSRRSANDGSAGGRAQLVPFNHLVGDSGRETARFARAAKYTWTARYKRRAEAESVAGWRRDRSGSREA